ncbi:hypothetical protein AHiyo8_57270 [Arthrobacter sp. Hiyo8]|nr:hypothetical protein AHiyo8_57270 [Arthrobacter sp. Hiyo8]
MNAQGAGEFCNGQRALCCRQDFQGLDSAERVCEGETVAVVSCRLFAALGDIMRSILCWA